MSKINLPNKRKEIYLSRRKFNEDGDIIQKKCSDCNEFLVVEEYFKNKQSFDGLYQNCKVCFREFQKEKYKEKKHKEILEKYGDDYIVGMENSIEDDVTHKVCKDCDIEKPLKEFYKTKRGKYGVDSYCKKCSYIRRKK